MGDHDDLLFEQSWIGGCVDMNKCNVSCGIEFICLKEQIEDQDSQLDGVGGSN